MCGILGIISKDRDVLEDGIVLLNAENHRGEQACGAVVFDGKTTRHYYGEGKVAEVFGYRDQERWSKLRGSACVMHTLYSTIGARDTKTRQPRTQQPVLFKFHGRKGAVSHNGNLIMLDGLRKQAKRAGYKFKSETSDTEVIAALLSISKKKTFLEALLEVLMKIDGKGSFSLAILYGDRIYGVKDRNGNRPLCIIKKHGEDGENNTYILASESCILPSLEATTFIREVGIGELVVLSVEGIERSIRWARCIKCKFCICEFIYSANPASRFFGCSVYRFRVKAGEMLAKKHPVKADVIVPVPESGRGYSDGFSSQSGIRSMEGLIKSRYTIRTFMGAREVNRGKKQRAKLQAIPDVMEDRDVCDIEDSIFRASVSPVVVKISREYGRARSVHLRVGSPPVRYTCHLGLDTSTKRELVASQMSVDEIRDRIVHSDSLEYLSADELKQVLRELGLSPDDFCFGCFTGEYPVEPPEE